MWSTDLVVLEKHSFSDRVCLGPFLRVFFAVLAGASFHALAAKVLERDATGYIPSSIESVIFFFAVSTAVFFFISLNYCFRTRIEAAAPSDTPPKLYLALDDPRSRYTTRIAFDDVLDAQVAAVPTMSWRSLLSFTPRLEAGVTTCVRVPGYHGDTVVLTYRYLSPFEQDVSIITLQIPCTQAQTLVALLPPKDKPS